MKLLIRDGGRIAKKGEALCAVGSMESYRGGGMDWAASTLRVGVLPQNVTIAMAIYKKSRKSKMAQRIICTYLC